ncbi:MAG: hypothetical protein ACFBSF_15755 [Leptolyngbyaceae cyanobacterium]
MPTNMLPVESHRALSAHQRLMYMAEEYKRRGYEVSIYPTDELLPKALQGLSVGLVARASGSLVIGDVRSREQLTLNGPKDLRMIARQVETIPNSYFDLVVTNPA